MSDTVVAAGRETPRRWMLRWVVGATRYAFIRIRRRLLLEASIESLLPVTPAIAVRYRFGNAGGLEQLSQIDPRFDESAKRAARQRLNRGDWLILGEHDGRPIFSVWLMFGAIDAGTGRTTRPISPQRAYSYKLYTAEAFRGRGVASGVYAFLAPFLSAKGCRRIVCWISDRNVASLRMHERTGFAAVGRLYEVRLLGFWKTYWWGPGLARLLRSSP